MGNEGEINRADGLLRARGARDAGRQKQRPWLGRGMLQNIGGAKFAKPHALYWDSKLRNPQTFGYTTTTQNLQLITITKQKVCVTKHKSNHSF